ncbi:MAG TPA: glycosyltransferase family 87 protein [Candidatus Binatia bacterium]|nr:glycosyltransferase family 87 protein [Candidatus Binatia bacterium]
MTQQLHKGKTIFIITVVVLIGLNLYTFIAAYPETYTPSPGITATGSILAKDYSAYYVGAWRLWHNPSQIYTLGALGGAEPVTPPHPEAYKYLPSFLVIVSPFLSLDYQQALVAFDIIQFMLLPAIAYIIYELLDNKHFAVTLATLVIALLLPFPTPNWGLSPSYFWQWGEGQAKVFLTFLLLVSFYFGKKNRPFLSGVALALGFFDVRFGLLSVPLFVLYNRKNLKPATASAIVALASSNVMLLYPGMASGFAIMVFGSGIITPLYYYALIPFFTLMALIAVNFKELVAAFDYKGAFTDFTGATKRREN